MWFRVELHKDGSVASCETVEGKLKDGKHVFYVEAETKEKALADVVSMYRKVLERARRGANARYSKRRAANSCGACDSPPVPGKTLCEKHLRNSLEIYRRARDRKRGLLPQAPRLSEEERATREESKRLEREARYKREAVEKFGMTRSALFIRRGLLREALGAYDSDPRNFRAWLVSKLKSLGVDVDDKKREPFAYESAAE